MAGIVKYTTDTLLLVVHKFWEGRSQLSLPGPHGFQPVMWHPTTRIVITFLTGFFPQIYFRLNWYGAICLSSITYQVSKLMHHMGLLSEFSLAQARIWTRSHFLCMPISTTKLVLLVQYYTLSVHGNTLRPHTPQLMANA